MYKILLIKPKFILGISLLISLSILVVTLVNMIRVINAVNINQTNQLPSLNPGQKIEEALVLIKNKTNDH